MRVRGLLLTGAALTALAVGAADATAQAPEAQDAAKKPFKGSQPPACKPGRVARRIGTRGRWRCVRAARLPAKAGRPVVDLPAAGLRAIPLERLRPRGRRRAPRGALAALQRLNPRGRERVGRTLGVLGDTVLDVARTSAPGFPALRARAAGGARAAGLDIPGVKVGPNGNSATIDIDRGADGRVTGSGTIDASGLTHDADGSVSGSVTFDGTVSVTGKGIRDALGTDVKVDVRGRATIDSSGVFSLDDLSVVIETDNLRITVNASGLGRIKSADTCPTSAGEASSSADITFRYDITIALRRLGVRLVRFGKRTDFTEGEAAQTADDAKLDDVDVLLTGSSESYGEASFLGGSRAAVQFQRRTLVNMRTGAIGPLTGGISASGGASGIGALGQPDDASVERSLAEADAELTKTFRSTVDNAIKDWRRREAKWLQPGACLALSWNPPTDSRKVTRGDSGALAGSIRAKRDGGAPKGLWARTELTNGTVEPAQAASPENGPAQLTWTVTGSSGALSTRYKVTSKAGVDEQPWRLEIEPARDRSYRVLAATLTEKRTGVGATVIEHKPGWQPCTLATTDQATMALGPQPFDETNRIDERGSGIISAIGDATLATDGTGCTETGTCPVTDSGPTIKSVFVAVAPTADPRVVKVTWNAPPFFIPWTGVLDFGCYSDNISPQDQAGGGPPDGYDSREVPTDVFDASTPQTLSFTYDATVVSSTGVRVRAEVTHSITFQRVRADGSPL